MNYDQIVSYHENKVSPDNISLLTGVEIADVEKLK